MPNGQIPTPVLPNLTLAANSPFAGLQEIRVSFSQSLANIEGALATGLPGLPTGLSPLGLLGGLPNPLGGSLGGIRFPRIEEFFKGPAAALAEIQGASTGALEIGAGAPPAAPTPQALVIG